MQCMYGVHAETKHDRSMSDRTIQYGACAIAILQPLAIDADIDYVSILRVRTVVRRRALLSRGRLSLSYCIVPMYA